MTIAVAIASPEGLVLAADSRTSLITDGKYRIVSDHAHKVFSLNGRFGAVTTGWAFLGGKTIAGVMEEFEARTDLSGDTAAAAAALAVFFSERITAHVEQSVDELPPDGTDVLEFVIGGYDRERGIGELYDVLLPSQTVNRIGGTDAPTFVWRGEWDVFSRLLKGVDYSRLDLTTQSAKFQQAVEGVEYHVPIYRMTLQDAVDFADFVVRTTVDMQRFSDGTNQTPSSSPTCGGRAEIIALSQRQGVTWVAQNLLRRPSKPGLAEGAVDG